MIKSCARAPSNIALIKYMGKVADAGVANLPANPSLSLTLDRLCSFAEVSLKHGAKPSSGAGDAGLSWVPELPLRVPDPMRDAAAVPNLTPEGRARILRHLAVGLQAGPEILKRHGVAVGALDPLATIELRTANTFPHSSGIASSASSFAAVTLAAVALGAASPEEFANAWGSARPLRRELASLSRAGSGSSCRSFEGPWVLWEREGAEAIASGLSELTDFVILISASPKKISSSRAHELVKTSPLWDSRPDRAVQRLASATKALENGDLRQMSQLAWVEAWEMHSLFHTSAEPFSYWEPGTIDALHFLARFLKDGNPPIVTLDAGPNVHVIVESAHAPRWRTLLAERFGADRLLADSQGMGAAWVGGQ